MWLRSPALLPILFHLFLSATTAYADTYDHACPPQQEKDNDLPCTYISGYSFTIPFRSMGVMKRHPVFSLEQGANDFVAPVWTRAGLGFFEGDTGFYV